MALITRSTSGLERTVGRRLGFAGPDGIDGPHVVLEHFAVQEEQGREGLVLR